MARINIDNELWADPRFERLCDLVGRPHAVYALVCLWRTGQEYWLKEKSLIPSDVYAMLPHAKELEACLFAETREGKVYVRGSQEKWFFLDQSSKRAAGRLSAEARKNKFGSANPRSNSEKNVNKREQPVHKCSQNEAENVNRREQTRTDVNDTNTNTNTSTKNNKYLADARCLYEAWNQEAKLSQVKHSKGRDRIVSSRYKEIPDPEYWRGVARRIGNSDFCRGKNDREWIASFDWFIKPDTHLKVMEGQYGCAEAKRKTQSDEAMEILMRQMQGASDE